MQLPIKLAVLAVTLMLSPLPLMHPLLPTNQSVVARSRHILPKIQARTTTFLDYLKTLWKTLLSLNFPTANGVRKYKLRWLDHQIGWATVTTHSYFGKIIDRIYKWCIGHCRCQVPDCPFVARPKVPGATGVWQIQPKRSVTSKEERSSYSEESMINHFLSAWTVMWRLMWGYTRHKTEDLLFWDALKFCNVHFIRSMTPFRQARLAWTDKRPSYVK